MYKILQLFTNTFTFKNLQASKLSETMFNAKNKKATFVNLISLS